MTLSKKVITGILGTLIFHLVLLNVFFIVNLSSGKNPHREKSPIIVEFDEPEEKEEMMNNQLAENEDYTNLAKNLDEEVPDELQNTRHARRIYELMKAEEEMLEELDEQDQNNAMMSREEALKNALGDEYDQYLEKRREIPEVQEKIPFPENFEPPEDLEDKKMVVEGPTTISYRLKDREGLYLPVPVYKCPEGGTITVSIVVTRNGMVAAAAIDKEKSRNLTPCLSEAALQAAKKSVFNPDGGAEPEQQGEIIYTFIAQ